MVILFDLDASKMDLQFVYFLVEGTFWNYFEAFWLVFVAGWHAIKLQEMLKIFEYWLYFWGLKVSGIVFDTVQEMHWAS